MSMEILAIASVVAQVGPVFISNQGFSSVTRAGDGDYTLKLDNSSNVDTTACSVQCTVRGALAASGLVAFGVVHTDDTFKRVTILQEGEAGAASALADINFDITITRYF
jgi:hypothetical protein